MFLRDELEHRALERMLVHLSVTDDDPRLGHQALQQVADREDRFDAVVDEIHLSAARELVENGAPDDFLIELDDIGLNREAILRRRLDDRHVADADERHVQRARDGRRAHREHVDFLFQLLDLLLVRDAEPLLFVHDEQTEVSELDVLRQQPVRADDDVDLAGREVADRLFLLLLRAEAADHVDPHRKPGEPLAQRLLMLERQHGRRREEGDLLAVHDCLEGGAHRDLGFSVADVAAQETVHGRRRLHVALDVAGGGLLIRGQLVLERVLELLLPVRVAGEGVARHGAARGVELEQLLRHVAHRFLDSGLRALPRRAAQPVDRRLRRAGVLLHEVEALDRHEQLVVARVAQLEELLAVALP